MKKIYLLSNPTNGFTNFVGNNLAKDLQGKQKKIVFLPCNYLQEKSNEKYHVINTSWFEEYNIQFIKNTLLNRTMSEKEIKKELSEANILFIMGGKQLEQMKFCYIKNIINDITHFNGIIIGICAGAINMSKIVTSLYLNGMDCPIQTYYKGFSLVDINILPHIKRNSLLHIDNNDYVVLDDDASIIIENGEYKYDGKYNILYFPRQNYQLREHLKNYDNNILSDDIKLVLINIVFVSCNDYFERLTNAQKNEYKQMFKYVILRMNMNYDCFIKNFKIIKESYKIKGNPNLNFLYNEFLAVNTSIRLAKKFIKSHINKLSIKEISNIIYDRYGVTYNELSQK